MPSPFPGMNPYIEQDAFWQDFHLEFLPAIRERLVAQVRPKYIVLLDEHIYVQELPREPRRLVGRADVSLAAPPRPRAEETAGVGILEAPAQVQIPVQDVRRVPFLEIRDRLGRELITVLEMLSPANKRGARIASNIWPSASNCSRVPPISWRSTCCAAAGRCPWRIDPDAITPSWSAAPRLAPGRVSGRSGCASACPSSRSRWPRPIRTPGSISRRSSITSTTRPATTTSSTPAGPIRHSPPGMPPGHGSSCRRRLRVRLVPPRCCGGTRRSHVHGVRSSAGRPGEEIPRRGPWGFRCQEAWCMSRRCCHCWWTRDCRRPPRLLLRLPCPLDER